MIDRNAIEHICAREAEEDERLGSVVRENFLYGTELVYYRVGSHMALEIAAEMSSSTPLDLRSPRSPRVVASS